MNNITEKNLCTGCGICASICPQKAVKLKPDKEGFLYPSIDQSLCTRCSLCTRKCPVHTAAPADSNNLYFCSHAKDDKIRSLGSSGGIFPLLALHVLHSEGYVFGASLTEDGSVIHRGINKPERLEELTRTKYVQSEISGVLKKVYCLLEEGHTVLFCGTPCQTEGLRSYLGKNYENLILVDLICYGVPSPGIWQRYIQFLEKKYNSKFRGFYFRDKRNRDNGHTVNIQFEDRKYYYSIYKDLFLKSYFRNINIRPSCYKCNYCTPSRNSDITLGDFWGLERVKPEFDDGMGNSLLICHTKKGKCLFDSIKEQTEWFPCKENDALQPRLTAPTDRSPMRWICMHLYRWLPFSLWLRLFS